MITPGALPDNASILEVASIDFSSAILGGAEDALQTMTSRFLDSSMGHTFNTGFLGWMFKMDKAGLYMLIPSCQLSNQSANTGGYTRMQINSVTVMDTHGYVKGAGGNFNCGGIPVITNLAVNDLINFRGFHDDGVSSRLVSARLTMIRLA